MSTGPSPQQSVIDEKRALRAAMRAQREALDARERARASADLSARLAALPEVQAAGCLAAFVATRGEVDLSTVVSQRVAAGARVALPRVAASTPEAGPRLRFHLVTPETELQPGTFGILEPPASSPELGGDELDVVLLPGLAFDAGGRRLGYGGGYYDELIGALARAGSRPLLIGVGFDFQLVERCPAGEGDAPIDWVVTDARVVRCRPGEGQVS
jgi:5-formyltetrahydrofolate cyclo-ligase